MRGVAFWVELWAVVLLPWVLLVIGRRASSEYGISGDSADRRSDGLQFARGLAGLSCTMPAVVISLSLLPEKVMRVIGPEPMIFCHIIGSLAGVGAFILYLAAARGTERLTGAFASMVGVGVLILSMMAGSAAA